MNKNLVLNNKKIAVVVKGKESLGYIPRFYWSKGTKKLTSSVLVKCGCCNGKVKVYYGYNVGGIRKYKDDTIEINDVLAHKDFWKLLFEKIGLLGKKKK